MINPTVELNKFHRNTKGERSSRSNLLNQKPPFQKLTCSFLTKHYTTSPTIL